MITWQSHWKRSVFCLLVALLAIPLVTHAQDYRGKVQGVVTDANGAALASAKVILRNNGPATSGAKCSTASSCHFKRGRS